MVVSLAAGDQAPVAERLQTIGFATRSEGGRVLIELVQGNSWHVRVTKPA